MFWLYLNRNYWVLTWGQLIFLGLNIVLVFLAGLIVSNTPTGRCSKERLTLYSLCLGCTLQYAQSSGICARGSVEGVSLVRTILYTESSNLQS